MSKQKPESWVVYRTASKGMPEGATAVCERSEWEAMEAARPGQQTLVQEGIVNEGVAERLARGKSGDPVPRVSRPAVLPAVDAPPPTAPAEPGV